MRRLVALGVVCGLLAVAVPNLIVWLGGRTPVTTDVAKVPHAQAALVLGAQVYRDGRPSIMLARPRERRRGALQGRPRGQAAAVRRPLAPRLRRGRHDARACCSRRASRREDIFTDHAGFDTWDSAQRAKRVFDVSSAVVVTQRFHMARALYDARRAGPEGHGLRRRPPRLRPGDAAAAGPRGRRAGQDPGRRRDRRRPAFPRRRDPDQRRRTGVVGGLIEESISSVGT